MFVLETTYSVKLFRVVIIEENQERVGYLVIRVLQPAARPIGLPGERLRIAVDLVVQLLVDVPVACFPERVGTVVEGDEQVVEKLRRPGGTHVDAGRLLDPLAEIERVVDPRVQVIGRSQLLGEDHLIDAHGDGSEREEAVDGPVEKPRIRSGLLMVTMPASPKTRKVTNIAATRTPETARRLPPSNSHRVNRSDVEESGCSRSESAMGDRPPTALK